MSIHKRSYKKADGSCSIYYLAVVKTKGCKTRSKQFKRKIDAEAWEREQRVLFKADLRHTTDERTVRKLADYWLDHFAKRRLEYSSLSRYDGMLRNYILPEFAETKLRDLNPLHVERWLSELCEQRGLGAKSTNGCLGLLRKMLNDAVHWRWITHNPVAGVRPLHEDQKEFAFWTLKEGERFLRHTRQNDSPLYYASSLSLYTGMRLGEIQALKWDAVNFGARLVTVKRTFCQKEGRVKERTKTKCIRRIPINSSLYDVMAELKNRSRCDFVLPDFDYRHASRVLKRAAKEAGVKPIRFHDLRHSFASNFVMAGGEIYKLQRLLGHSSIQMTERYSHLSPDHLADATEILDFGTKLKGAKVIPMMAR